MANPYETTTYLNEYLLLHYGGAKDVFGDLPGPRDAVGFPARTVSELVEVGSLGTHARALEVGCAVGRAAFELARFCSGVTALDYSSAFIHAAKVLQSDGFHDAELVSEGDNRVPFRAVVPMDVDRSRVAFAVGDAMDLPDFPEPFDVVIAANLLCRLHDPSVFLAKLPMLVRPDGQLVLTTPLTWLEEFTPRANWLGGRRNTPDSFTEISRLLAPHFDLETRKDLPFVYREHARKFQYVISLGSRWRRKS